MADIEGSSLLRQSPSSVESPAEALSDPEQVGNIASQFCTAMQRILGENRDITDEELMRRLQTQQGAGLFAQGAFSALPQESRQLIADLRPSITVAMQTPAAAAAIAISTRALFTTFVSAHREQLLQAFNAVVPIGAAADFITQKFTKEALAGVPLLQLIALYGKLHRTPDPKIILEEIGEALKVHLMEKFAGEVTSLTFNCEKGASWELRVQIDRDKKRHELWIGSEEPTRQAVNAWYSKLLERVTGAAQIFFSEKTAHVQKGEYGIRGTFNFKNW